MFKLESYITPILLNHVAKYVKNFRDEDAQVSLWEGEVTFQNLDLRLEVLEEELNLPVELVSGHIHELSIQVPWTKLMSEPVKIVINTIEFVAKLPDSETKQRKQEQRRKSKRLTQESDQQPGPAPASSSSVVNKIINNITLQCNNVILKYVEDDIVVSMNVQRLNFTSAGEDWKPTMVDMHPVYVVMRKLLQISDLTICLDKRNTAGRIEVCQEPVLYRCSLECRVLRKYNANTVSTSSITRVGVLTKALDINVSSLQFPIVMRLVKLLIELKPVASEEEPGDSDDETEETPEGHAAQQGTGPSGRSILWWAWNMLPSFDAEAPATLCDERVGHAFDIGIYAEELNFHLKNSEYFTDHSMGGIKRIRYTPILRISLGGLYYERSEVKECEWTNVKAGLSSMCVEPLGVYRSEELVDRNLVNTETFIDERSFIDKSLFDENYMFADRTWCSYNYEEYSARNTDEYMLFRSPVLAFDIVEYRVPQKANHPGHPLAESQLRDSGLRIQYRVLSAGITFHFSQSFAQVKNVITDLIRPYDYSGYHSETVSDVKALEEHADMTVPDLEYLVTLVPTCNYKIELRNMVVQLYPRQQQEETSASNQHQLTTTVKQSLLPYLQLKISLVEGTLCGPANPKRLVQLITHLQDKPREVVNACYNSYSFSLKNVTLIVLNTTPDGEQAKLLSIPRMQVNWNRLLLPHLWRQNEAATLEKAELKSEIMALEFSKRELILAKRLVPLISSFDASELCFLAHIVSQANVHSDVIKLQTMGTKFSLSYQKYHSHLAVVASLQGIQADVVHTKMNARNVVLSTSANANNKWLEIQLQFPLEEANPDEQKEKAPGTVVCLWMEPFCITTDIYLLQFLNFSHQCGKQKSMENDTKMETLGQSEPPITQSLSNYSTISAMNDLQPRRISRNNSRKISVPEETVHLSSERDERHTQTEPINLVMSSSKPKATTFDPTQLVHRLSNLVVLVEFAQAQVNVCEAMMRKKPAEVEVEYTSISLPNVKVKSGNCDSIQRGNIRSVVWVPTKAELFNWVIDLNEFNVSYRRANVTEMIVAPVRTTITLALSHKIESLEGTNSQERLSKSGEESSEQGTYSINVHVDMSAINIFAQRVKLLHEHCQILSKAYSSLHPDEPPASKGKPAEIKPRLEVYTGSSQNYTVIKEFLELDPNFEAPKPEAAPKISLVIFCQWTIPRICLEMENSVSTKHSKIVAILEDLLLNIDRHSDFTKITTKVENFGLNYYEERQAQEWERVEDFRIKMLGDSGTNLPLFSVVVTTVSLQDLYAKIGARNPHNKQHTISEVLIDIQPIEMVLDLDQITEFMIPLCEVLEIMNSSSPEQADDSSPCSSSAPSQITTVQDLPMVHLNSKGIYVYLPLSTGRKSCSVLLLRIESIQLTPSLENPLVRQLVRPDIYQKAAELNMLNTPGALVEDRQYELSVRKVSLSTGNWKQTQKYRLEKSLASKHNNPAFEWNNQSQATELHHMEIFKDFDFIMIYAPAISYDRYLVCGQSVEYNCVTDFVSSLNTHQISLISCLIVRMQWLNSIIDKVCVTKNDAVYKKRSHRTLGEISGRRSTSDTVLLSSSNPKKCCANFSNRKNSRQDLTDKQRSSSFLDARASSDIFYGSCQSDSGINLSGSRGKGNQRSVPADDLQRGYPRSVSFVAGIFVLKIYDVLDLEDLEVLERPAMKPLLLILVSQPSFMSTQNLKASVTQASIFNININVATPSTGENNTELDQFNEPIFDTLPGQLSSSGIPPPLLTMRTQYDRLHQKEVDVELRKPILLRLCETRVKQLASDVIRIYTVLHETPCFAVRSQRPVEEGSQLRQMKTNCYNADRMHLSSDRITIKFYDEDRSYKCSLVCLDFSTRVKFSARPQKAVIRSTLGSIYVQSGGKMLLHPLLMRLSVDLVSEPWCDELLINATFKLNFLHVDAGVLSILQLQKAQDGVNRIREYANEEWQQFLHRRPALGTPEEISPSDLIKCTPSHESIERFKRPLKSTAEFYQDDLRAGAFQFVYLNSESVLPMPYQVQIIKKNYGIICWRYPQPRQMTNILIYPVPMPVSHPIQIRCRMEYFSETHETFLHYCGFLLSETATRQLTPPSRPICATIWRVVILQSLIAVDGTCFENDTDEDLSIEYIHSDFKAEENNDFILHPKVLVGCMRIDTVFRPEMVPKLLVLLRCQDIELNFLNQPDVGGELPPPLKEYRLRQSKENSQTFLTVHVEDLQMHSTIYSRKDFSVQTELRSRVKCLDYGFLNMLDIVEPMKFTSYVRVIHRPRSAVEANFVVDKLRLNCAPYVIHTLLSSKLHWQQVLQQREVRHAFMPKCLVVNRMQTPIGFGQTGTVERITLAPSEVQFYHFRSCSFRQELTFFITNPQARKTVESSDSVHIPLKFEEEHKVQHLRVGDCCITLKMAKLSATQIYILVKGQIELISMVPHSLVAEFRVEGASCDENGPSEHLLSSNGRSSSFYQQVMRNADINMRLKLSAGRGKGRTGDIPLKPNCNNLPWLVKVPTQSPQQFISLWVRILRENIVMEPPAEDFQPQKILICIWPIFEVCNMLSCDIQATESTSEESAAIEAKGGSWPLNTATTHCTEHKVSFKFSAPLEAASECEYMLMLKNMDWQKFFHYDSSVWTIENALHQLSESSKVMWPLNDPEELRQKRELMLPWKSPFDVRYQTGATREFSCTLGLNVTAWAMFINATGLDVSLCTIKEPARIQLKANSLEMLPRITSAFSIQVSFNSEWFASTPICLEEHSAQKTDNIAGRTMSLRCNSVVDIVIVEKEQVFRLMLEYKQETDCRRVFKLRSKFVLTNFTDVSLNALPLAMDHKETATREEVDAYAIAKPSRSLTSSNADKNCIGTSLDVFYDLGTKHNCDTAFVYFVCFSVGGHCNVSIPIPLAIPFTRRCFSLQAGRESIPLMITLIEKDNVHYLNVFRDTAPAIIISNNTNIKFIVAQTSASENSNVSCTNSEFVGRHFEWNQLVLAHSQCYYTPPQMYANFPDVEFTMCNLSLAAYKDKPCAKNKIGWSKPVRTDKTWQKFLHIPNHGDVKVVVCDKHRVIRLNIYYIAQQLEFSVKDLRSRLTKPNNSLLPTEEQELLGSEEKSPEEQDPLPDMVACAHFSEECETKLQTRIKVFIKSFVFSLQTDNRENDYLKTEVCNIYADDLMAIYDDISDDAKDDRRELRLQLPNLQVDNQLYSSGKYDFPVLLCAEELYKRNCALPQVYYLDAVYQLQSLRSPVSLFTFVFYQDEMQLQSVRCEIPPFRVYIEDAYLNQLLEALVECEPSHCVYSPAVEQDRILLSAGQTLLPEQVVAQSLYISEPLRLNNFSVEPLSLLLSVHTSSRLYIALDHSPLSFSRYERQQILTVPLRFGQSLGLHYLSGAIFGAGWVVGSLEILGSPSGLARSFSIGLRDFVSMPVEGLFRGPWGFLVGVTQGSASLLRNVTAGTVNSVTKLAGSVARNLDRLTLDAEHIELTEARRRARPQGFADGLTQGLTGLGISLLGAVGGLAHHTLEARTSVGLIAGITKGIVGAFTKPISGAAEMLALTGQGVLHTVGFNAMPLQVEPSIARNVALHGSSSRIWSYLPEELSHDQMLFFSEITLLVSTQLRPALVFLTSSVLAIMQPDSEDLSFASPVSKVDVVADREDPSKLYLSLKSERKDDLEGQLNYTNERIMKFIHASRLQSIANDSLNDLLQLHEQDVDDRIQRQSQCIFYIKPNIGEHLIHYLKVISRIKD
ncbi:hypothetical protein KR054_001628 [Drosophila jambulina]|nr:hypothetical protein KR054_001628 [Drosophila jambulina]